MIKVDFQITGKNLNPELITKSLKIEPTKIWYSGERIIPSNNFLKYKVDGWLLSAACSDLLNIQPYFYYLIRKLQPQKNLIKKYCLEYYGEFACTIHLKEGLQVPAMHLNKDIIEFVSNIKAEIDFDIYNF